MTRISHSEASPPALFEHPPTTAAVVVERTPPAAVELEETGPVVVEVVDAELVDVDEHQGVVAVVDVDARLSAAAAAAIADSVPASTRRAYAADRSAYAAWCAQVGRTAVPATAETLAEYVHHLTVAPRPRTGRASSPASIARAMSSIGTWHEERGHGKPSTRGARAVLAGYRARLAEAKDPAATQRKASPAVPTALRAMLATLDRSTLLGRRDAAMVLIGFATAARVSELVGIDVADITRAEHGVDITVYRSKLRKHTTVAVLYGSDPATCPVRALDAYTAALAERGRDAGPLFVRLDRYGRIAPPMRRDGRLLGDPAGRLTGESAGTVVARLADAAGLDGDWSGHSLRRGFATAARRAGHDMLRIGRAGGWSDGSRSLAGYIEDADRVTESPLVGIGL